MTTGRKREDYVETFEKVWKTVRDRLYDDRMNGVDWKRIGESYRARLPQVQSKAEFAELMNRMLDELRVSHTGYFTDDDIEFSMLPAVMRGDLEGNRVAHIGVMGRTVGREYVVAGVLEGGPADRAGIQSGDHLLSVDGKPFTTAGSFRGKEGSSVAVTLRREGETETRVVRVQPVKENVLRAFLEATRRSARILRVDGKRLGYIHLWTMGHDAFSEALEELVLTKLYATDGLILDLRDGYGGHPWGFGDVFFRPDVAWEQQYRRGEPRIRHTGYAKPLVVLINGGTRSAKESFAYELHLSRRATLVGSRTAGAFLGAGSFPIGKEGLLELAVLGLKLDGKRLEGTGIAPDVAVTSAFSYTDRDAQLLRAEQVLLAAIEQRQPGAETYRNTVVH
jgi:carboxyl-terminal processing protease